jgi:YgiT-type zinc finger domain-containing protein
MNCIVCRFGTVEVNQRTTMTFEREGKLFIIKNVPASVCDSCGEAYFDQTTSHQVLAMARHSFSEGLELSVVTWNDDLMTKPIATIREPEQVKELSS